MKYFLILITFLSMATVQSQDLRLAENYMDQGEYSKAEKVYREYFEINKRNPSVVYKLVDVNHQLKRYARVDSLLTEVEKLMPYDKSFLIERGYNLVIQNKPEEAKPYYKQALEAVKAQPNLVYSIANRFEQRRALDEAIAAYEIGMAGNEESNFNLQLARLYGEQGKLEKMFDTYVNLVEKTPNYRPQAQAVFSQFITEDQNGEANNLLRKVLLLRLRENPDPLYNQLLSWLFVQQKDFKKAFIQEKSIYLRDRESLNNLIELAVTAEDEKDIEAANEILNYIIQESQVPETTYFAESMKLDLEASRATKMSFPAIIEKYESLLDLYGRDGNTLRLQLDYANFLAFKANEPSKASELLIALEKLRLNPFQKADVKMLLADILVLQEQFNRALIFYSQIQNDLPNDTRAQESQFKVARTSYYQEDFKWSLTQLKVLRSAASKLIANDAMELSLMIQDHGLSDTTFVALKAFAKADLKQYQGNNNDAIAAFNQILLNFKGDDIEDETLLKLGRIYTEEENIEKAVENYTILIQNYATGILADDAYYELGMLYENRLKNLTKAQELYERIIYDHADSIHFVDARRRYRRLRGDETINTF